jgi:hypothetical protein
MPCSACAAKAEVAVAVGCSLSSVVCEVTAEEIETPDGVYLQVPGLVQALHTAFETGRLPCESGTPIGYAPQIVGMAEIIRAGF